MPTKFKPIRVKSFTGMLDTRSEPNEVGLGNFRLVLNASIRGRNKRCRRGGWKKLLDGVNDVYNNEDLHDQLLALSFYYQEGFRNIHIPGGQSGWSYPYHFPEIDTGDNSIVEDWGTLCAYAPDWTDVYDIPPESEWGVDSWASGWPYVYNFDTLPYDCNTGDPSYYIYPMLNLVYVWTYDGTFVPAYDYGNPSPVYTLPKSYLYEYCLSYPWAIDSCNEYITYLGSLGNADGQRTLLAGTRSRIYALNQSFGNWKIVADGLGTPPLRETQDCDTCSQERWMGAPLNNVMVLVNGANEVMAYNTISQPTGCSVWRATVIEDLQTLNVSSAGCVGGWKTFIFIGDLFQDGARHRNRIAWCDSGDPYSWIPGTGSLAGYQDLGNDETILRIEPLNDYLFVYTDQSIYRGAFIETGTTATFVFEEIYRGEEALKYKYAFANTGDEHLFWCENRLVRMTSFDKRPQEAMWTRAVSNSVFDGLTRDHLSFSALNENACNAFIGGYNPQYKEVWFSWPTGDDMCPTVSLVLNVTNGEYGADFVDAGFTAFHWYDGRVEQTLLDYLEDLQVCERENLLPSLVKEGMPIETVSDTFTDPATSIWNATEDITLPADENSLCAHLRDLWLRDVCTPCDNLSRFVMASAEDKTLKEYADAIYYREFLRGVAYTLEGYSTVFESGMEDLDTIDEKAVNELAVAFTALPQSTPNLLYAYIGTGPQPDCVRWKQLRFYDDDCATLTEGVELACLTESTDEEHDAEWTRADEDARWPVDARAQFFAYRLVITGTGGGSCFSRTTMNVAVAEG